jgi:phosphonate transport system ATP-binding protein
MPDPAHSTAFKLEGVSKELGGHLVLAGVSFEIRRGERVGLIGPSGAGKTTLLRILAGMYQPSAGRLLVGGHMTGKLTRSELRLARRRTGFIHQSLDLVPELRVVSNVLAGRLGLWNIAQAARALLWPKRADLLGVHAALERVDLTDKMYARTDTLSGGQAQRVALARVLFQDPDAILADEPVSSVDPARARDLMRLLRDINESTGKPVIVSIHAVDLARDFCTRLIGLRGGRVVIDAKVADVAPRDFDALYALERDPRT